MAGPKQARHWRDGALTAPPRLALGRRYSIAPNCNSARPAVPPDTRARSLAISNAADEAPARHRMRNAQAKRCLPLALMNAHPGAIVCVSPGESLGARAPQDAARESQVPSRDSGACAGQNNGLSGAGSLMIRPSSPAHLSCLQAAARSFCKQAKWEPVSSWPATAAGNSTASPRRRLVDEWRK